MTPYDRLRSCCNISAIVVVMVGFYSGNAVISSIGSGMALVNLAHEIFLFIERRRDK